MKRWIRIAIVAALVIACTIGGLYEYSSHVVRGSMRGEAFYDGRPTSYWAGHIDGWVARFDTPADAERHLRSMSIISSTFPTPPRPTLWDNVCASVHLHALRSGTGPPDILCAGSHAEAVWRELEATPSYAGLVDRARRNAVFWELFRKAVEVPR